MGVLASPSSTIRARYRHIEDGFPRSISSSRPVDISTSINPYRARFPELDLFIEAGWHIELGKVVSSSVAQKTKLIRVCYVFVSCFVFVTLVLLSWPSMFLSVFVYFLHCNVVLLSKLYCLAVLVIFGIVSFYRYCPVFLTVLLEIIIIVIWPLKFMDDLHIIQTFSKHLK